MIIDTQRTEPLAPDVAPPDLITQEQELIDLLTGEILDRKDADALIASFERADRTYKKLAEQRRQIAFALAALTSGETRTRRVRGPVRQAKVEMPEQAYSQPILKEAWNSFPVLSREYLRIGVIDVQRREVAKLAGTSGPPDFEQFKRMLKSAECHSDAAPRITVEE